MRKFFPVLLALAAFAFAFLALSPGQKETVAVAARDLPAGHLIEASDLKLVELPKESTPPDAVADILLAVGQTLALPRSEGDVIRASQFGAPITLQADERAIAVSVTDSSGLAGILQPGQRVGVTAVMFDQASGAAYSKVALGGLRVLYQPPAFRAVEPDPQSSGAFAPSRDRESVVVLAVPVAPQTVVYDLRDADGNPLAATRTISPLELLAALDVSPNAKLSLFLEPSDATPFISGGLYLPDLNLAQPATDGGGR